MDEREQLNTLAQQVAGETGLPLPFIHSMIETESQWNPRASNLKSKDYGLFQINRQHFGKEGFPKDERDALDPSVSARAAARLLKEAAGRWGPNALDRVAAEYNGGFAMAQSGPPYGNQQYVDKVMGGYQSTSGRPSFEQFSSAVDRPSYEEFDSMVEGGDQLPSSPAPKPFDPATLGESGEGNIDLKAAVDTGVGFMKGVGRAASVIPRAAGQFVENPFKGERAFQRGFLEGGARTVEGIGGILDLAAHAHGQGEGADAVGGVARAPFDWAAEAIRDWGDITTGGRDQGTPLETVGRGVETAIEGILTAPAQAALLGRVPVLGRASRGFVEQMSRSPGMAVAEEIAGSIGAEAAVQELPDDAGVASTLAAAVAGGALGNAELVAGRLAGRGVQAAARGAAGKAGVALGRQEFPNLSKTVFGQSRPERRADELLQYALGGQPDPNIPQAQARGQRRARTAQEANTVLARLEEAENINLSEFPTLGAAGGSPGLASLESEVIRRDPYQTTELVRRRLRGQAGLVDQFRGMEQPARPLQDSADITAGVESIGNRISQRAASRVRLAVEEAERQVRALPSGAADLPTSRANLGDALQQSGDKVFGDLRKRLDGIVKSSGQTPLKMEAFVDAFDEVDVRLGERVGERAIPDTISEALRGQMDETGKKITYPVRDNGLPLADVVAIERQLEDNIDRLRKAGRNDDVLAANEKLYKALQKSIRESTVPAKHRAKPGQAPKYNKMRKAAQEFKEFIAERDATRELWSRRTASILQDNPQDVYQRILRPDSDPRASASTQRLKDLLAADPSLAPHVEDVVIRQAFFETADQSSGVFNAEKLKAFTKKYGGALESLPNTKKALSNVLSAQDRVNRMGLREKGINDAFGRGQLAQMMKDPDRVVVDILGQTSAGRQRMVSQWMTKLASNPPARDAFRKKVWYGLVQNAIKDNPNTLLGNEVFLDPGTIYPIIRDNEGLLTQLYDKDHVDRMRKLADQSANWRRVAESTWTEPMAVNPVQQASESVIATSIAQIYGIWTKLARFGITGNRLSRAINDKRARQILEEVFTNKEMMKVAMTRMTKGNERALMRMLAASSNNVALKEELQRELEEEKK